MSARSTARSIGVLGLALVIVTVPGGAAAQSPPPGGPACVAEVEPNDAVEGMRPLDVEFCLQGTLVEASDQDLFTWAVAPEEGMTTWSFTMRGVPTTITSVHVLVIDSAEGATPLQVGREVARVDSDAHADTPPGEAEVRLAPGRYLLGISRGPAGFGQTITDDRDWELRVVRGEPLPPPGDIEPNDAPTTATAVHGAFELSGDMARTIDDYRWTTTADDAATPWRVEARTSIGAALTLDLRSAAGEPILSAQAGTDGVAVIHDAGLPAGDYLIALSPGAYQAQPYVLRAEPVTEPGADPEPNDVQAKAILLDPATPVGHGRLTSNDDVDMYQFDVDAALSAGLVDIGLTWAGGRDHSLCLATESGSPIGCQQDVAAASFTGLLLPVGRYLLKVSGYGDLADPYELRVASGGAPPPLADVEPNDDATTAGPVAGGFAVSGDLTGGPDVFAWTLSDADAARTWQLDVSATPGLPATLDLVRLDGTGLVRVRSDQYGAARVWDLRLLPGTYTVLLSPDGANAPRYILRSAEETAADIDPEPNDAVALVVPLDPSTLRARGRIATSSDVDTYSFEINEAMAATLTDASLTSTVDSLYQLCVAYDHGAAIQCRESSDGVSLADLQLAAGHYTLQVSGHAAPDARYDVHVGPGRPPAPDHESEPNDVDTAPTTWDQALVMHGTSLDGDVDVYRVHVDGVPQVWRLDVRGTGLGRPGWRQPDGTRVGEPAVSGDGTSAVVEDLYLVNGDHLLTLAAQGEYTLALTPLGPPDPAAEHEPNDDTDHAGHLAFGGSRTGRLPVAEDVDVFRFSLSAPEHIIATVDPPSGGSIGLEITSAGSSLAQVEPGPAGGPTVFDGSLPEGDYELRLHTGAMSDGEYAVRLERADPFVTGSTPAAPGLPVTLSLTTSPSEVAAYWRDGQRVPATLTIENTGGAGLALALDTLTSHHAWTVASPASPVAVAAGGSVDVPLVVHVPPDAWLGVPVRVSVRARDADGASGTAFVEITPARDVAPVDPEMAWSLPPELLGGLDMASAALEAVPVDAHNHEVYLHDGLSIAGSGMSSSLQSGPFTLGVDLAGDEAVPVAGVILNPLAVDGTFAARPRAFELLLSQDGVTYEPALSGELQPALRDQAFVLDAPVLAQYAQLRIDTDWGGTEAQFNLGEWKVVATPGFVPDPAPLNLASPPLGGHLVWLDPPDLSSVQEILDEAPTAIGTRQVNSVNETSWMIGFAHDRAAQVTRLEWVEQPTSDPAYHLVSVDVEASLDSPFGPWRPLGTWSLERAADGTVPPLQLAEPTWARFLRYRATGSPAQSGYWALPDVIRVLERPTDETYRSILGEWGQSDPRGIYEALVPPTALAGSLAPDAPDTPEMAATLAASTVADGQVARNKDVDWFAVTIPASDNALRLQVRSDRASAVHLQLQDATGLDVPVESLPSLEGGYTTWSAVVEPGATYRVGLDQPILSSVFTFDTSASIAPWWPLIRSGVGSFAKGVMPGWEAVQVFAFGEPKLLEGWSDQPYLIGGAIDGWVSAGGSSALESSVLSASILLSEREGTRAVLAVGDGVGGGFLGGLPLEQLDPVRPAIFPVHVGAGDDPIVSTHIMEDLAAAGGGFYQYATAQTDIERAFDRMATWLRRPADYSLSFETSRVEYPPGRIHVVAPEGAPVPIGGGVAVELVLDTSGSMLIPLEGTTRIAVAKKVLTRLVNESLPEGVPVALRTFVAKKKSCDSRLAVPLGPLERARMTDVIDRLKINKTTSTPIAGALAKVLGDLGSSTGPRIVVLVTDGQESCKGDPAAAVQTLVDAGVDATINIVGLALEDPELKVQMGSWAATGGGTFYDAQDAESLLAGITAALQAPYRVYDQDGALVASGVVGGPAVELPVGTYRVEVLTDPLLTFESVVLGPGGAVELTVGEAPAP